MKSITINNLPDDVNEKEMSMIVAVKLFDDGKLTSGQAAAIAGVSKRAFIENIGEYGVSIFQQSPEDLLNDVENAARGK
jgi:predicted HTH domain antitoxin